jgi:hypothetical protein
VREAIAQEALHEMRLLTEKNKIFSIVTILLRRVAGGLEDCMWPRVTSGITSCLRGSPVASGGLGGSGVALGVMNRLVSLQMASGTVHGLLGSWVAMGGRKWPMEVAVDLGGSLVTLIHCQIFINAPNFKIKKLHKATELPSFFDVDRK